MASAATKKPQAPARRKAAQAHQPGTRKGPASNGKARKAPSANGKAPVKRKAGTAVAKTAAKSVTPGSGPLFGGVARKVATKAAREALERMLTTGAESLRTAAEQTAEVSRRAYESGLNRRLPIQVAVDVAVPIRFAWEEWLRFESLCEGVDCVHSVERDGDMLYGRIGTARPREWEAEILDERPCESFAWRSTKGSDCAGLVTFHSLSDRLTRIEQDLDVVPAGAGQAVLFASHLAHRRADAQLRRFKAELEFVDPDVYAEDDEDPDEEDH
jgi:uncharacterized membrane protein